MYVYLYNIIILPVSFYNNNCTNTIEASMALGGSTIVNRM